jgi:hypothetical protein
MTPLQNLSLRISPIAKNKINVLVSNIHESTAVIALEQFATHLYAQANDGKTPKSLFIQEVNLSGSPKTEMHEDVTSW